MGLDTIPNRLNGQTIDQEWYNVLRRVLAVDLVPRNTSGVVTPAAGSLGDSTNLWQNLFLNFLKLAANSNLITINPPGSLSTSYALTLPNALPATKTRLSVDASGIVSFSDKDYQISSDSGTYLNTTADANYYDTTNLSLSITTTGRPVFVLLIPGTTATDDVFVGDTSPYDARLRFLRGSTSVGAIDLNDGSAGTVYPPGAFCAFDPVAAGTYTYKFQTKLISGLQLQVRHCKLAAFEI